MSVDAIREVALKVLTMDDYKVVKCLENLSVHDIIISLEANIQHIRRVKGMMYKIEMTDISMAEIMAGIIIYTATYENIMHQISSQEYKKELENYVKKVINEIVNAVGEELSDNIMRVINRKMEICSRG